jgi:hypothetical protein
MEMPPAISKFLKRHAALWAFTFGVFVGVGFMCWLIGERMDNEASRHRLKDDEIARLNAELVAKSEEIKALHERDRNPLAPLLPKWDCLLLKMEDSSTVMYLILSRN